MSSQFKEFFKFLIDAMIMFKRQNFKNINIFINDLNMFYKNKDEFCEYCNTFLNENAYVFNNTEENKKTLYKIEKYINFIFNNIIIVKNIQYNPVSLDILGYINELNYELQVLEYECTYYKNIINSIKTNNNI